jgi:hypothetical protein
MSGDKAGPMAIVVVFVIWIFILLLLLGIFVYRLRRYVIWSRPSVSDSFVSRYCKMANDAMIFFWDSFSSSSIDFERFGASSMPLDSQLSDVSYTAPASVASVSEVHWTSNTPLHPFQSSSFDLMKGVSKPTEQEDGSDSLQIELQSYV